MVGFTKSKSERRPSAEGTEFKLEGWLLKQSTGKRLGKSWQDRFFAITGHYMNYYSNASKDLSELKASLDLPSIEYG